MVRSSITLLLLNVCVQLGTQILAIDTVAITIGKFRRTRWLTIDVQA